MDIQQWWRECKAKNRLRKAFYSAGIFIKFKAGDKEKKVFPKIRKVRFDEKGNILSYTFTLLNGIDPKELEKKEYVFQQYFGKGVEITGEVKTFTLQIQRNALPKTIPYDYEEIKPLIKDKVLPVVCGKDIANQWHIYDAVNNPNLLIFGQPGSGKSSILHVILSTLIQYYSPDELKLVLGDFKQAEFGVYEDVEHVEKLCFLPTDLAPILKKIKDTELKKRGELLKKHRVRHITKVPKKERPPLIVICIDEFVMIEDAKIMNDLLQILSLGRAYGIYGILALQRPSHSILDTNIRALLSVRMGFRTVDKTNAKMGETPGSEKISKDEPGTFLLKLDDLIELKAPYLNEDQVEKIVEPYKRMGPPPELDDTEEQREELTEEDILGVIKK